MSWTRDGYQAFRSLRARPALSAAVILLLAFGIGANTALFTVLYGLLLRPIPGVERPEELIRIRRTANARVQSNQSYPDYLDYRDQSHTLDALVAERLGAARLAGPPAQFVATAIVTGNYFQVLGARAAAGRLLSPDDDRVPDGHPVAVVSEKFAREQFGGSAESLGRTVSINGYAFTIAGVAAAPFQGVSFNEPTDVWIPMMMVRAFMTRASDYHWFTERRAGWLTYYGRLKRGVQIQTAQADLTSIARNLERLHPESNSGRGVELSAHPEMSPEQRASLGSLLWLLGAAVGVVLLITCGNVSILLLARTTRRASELAIRLALGAGRWTIVRHVMAEHVLLGAVGGGLGLIAAPWLSSLLRSTVNSLDPANAASAPAPQVLVFAAGLCLVAVLLCGLAPSLVASRAEAGDALKDSPRTAHGGGKLQRVWVVAQVALSVALVAAGSLVLGSMRRILAIDPGYRPEHVAMIAMDLSLTHYSPERGTQFFLDAIDRAAAMPGVRSASLAKSTPAIDWSDRVSIFRQGEAPAVTNYLSRAPGAVTSDCNVIAAGYFRTLGIPLVGGRDFTRADGTVAPRVAIVSHGLAERMWPGESPLGKLLVVPVEGRPLPEPLQVVGVAADSRNRSVLDEPTLLLYIPLTQTYDSIARLMIAVEGPPALYKNALLRLVQQANPDLPLRSATIMEDQMEQSRWRYRAAASLLGFFGILALALACTGIHGVVACTAERRVREIGIRMALGANRAHAVWQVVGQAMRLTAIGIAIGIPLAVWTKPLLATFLWGSGSMDGVAIAGVPLLFLLIAAVASMMPARRAAATDPAIALRAQ